MTRCGLTATNSADKPHYVQGWRMDSFGSVLQLSHNPCRGYWACRF